MKCNFPKKINRLWVIGDSKKGGRVAKSPFSAKSVQKSLNRKIKIDFFQKSTFF